MLFRRVIRHLLQPSFLFTRKNSWFSTGYEISKIIPGGHWKKTLGKLDNCRLSREKLRLIYVQTTKILFDASFFIVMAKFIGNFTDLLQSSMSFKRQEKTKVQFSVASIRISSSNLISFSVFLFVQKIGLFSFMENWNQLSKWERRRLYNRLFVSFFLTFARRKEKSKHRKLLSLVSQVWHYKFPQII